MGRGICRTIDEGYLNASHAELTEEEFSTLEESLNQCRVCGHRGLGGFDED